MVRRALSVLAAPVLAALALAACAVSPFPNWSTTAPASPAPAQTAGPRAMVAAANPHAAAAGMAVLERGGTAVDAAVAIQAMLSLVEPQSSGLGGGAFMMVYDADTRTVIAYDGREAAPMGATPDMFLGPDGKPLAYREAVVSGRATGVPGAVAMLAMAQKEHGRLPWSALFGDAIIRARDGFVVSPRMSRFVNSSAPQASQPDAVAYFTEADGTLVETGDVLRNPAYAETLTRLAAEGPRAIYEGPIAEAIVARTRAAPLPGTMTTKDLADYRPRRQAALCRPWVGHRVCTAPPPSSGVVLLQALLMVEQKPQARQGPASADAWTVLALAQRLMFADRDRWIGDPAQVEVPVEGLLDPAYVASRAALIGEQAGPPPAAGTPPGAPVRAPDRTLEPAGTSHFVVVDRWGNAVSMTTTVESIYGTGRMVGGFFLNNQLTDFSFEPRTAEGAPAANAVGPGKRPRSSMSPLIVTDPSDRFVAAVGSPGGSAILGYNLKTMVGLFLWNLSPQQAIDLPNVIGRGAGFGGEADKLGPELVAALKARGVEVRPGSGEESGLHVIMRRNGRLEGGADPRREGVVVSAD